MLAASIAVALSVMGPPPCTVAYHVEQLPPPVIGVMRREGDHCEIVLAARKWRFWELCAATLHETLHAHGLGHSTDPLDVMYPELWRPADPCRGKRPPQFKRGAVIELQ